LNRPGPANTWVLLDEDKDSLNAGGLGVGMVRAEWIDWLGTYHNSACGFAFADGHSEIHMWLDSTTKVVNGDVSKKPIIGSKRDWKWISEHTSALAN